MKSKQLLGKLALLTATLIWGSSFFIMKNTVENIPSSLLLAVRFSVGFILLALIFIKKWKLISRGYILGGFLAGTCLFFAYFTQTLGLTDPNTTPGKNAFLTAVYCVIVPFLFWLFNKKKPSVFNVVSAFVCIAGIWCIAFDLSGYIGWGDILTLVGGLFYALHIIVVFNFTKGKDVILITILQFGFSAVWAWLIGLFTEDITKLASIGKGDVLSLCYLALCCTTVALLLQNVGQKLVPPAPASIILSLESAFGVLFSLIFYDNEKVTMKILIGFVLVFGAVLISEALPSLAEKKKNRDKVIAK